LVGNIRDLLKLAWLHIAVEFLSHHGGDLGLVKLPREKFLEVLLDLAKLSQRWRDYILVLADLEIGITFGLRELLIAHSVKSDCPSVTAIHDH
jgi:hypothetical protein